MAGLENVGVTGLALLPDDMRRLFVFGETPESLADFGGSVIRSPRSDTVYAFLSAIGATPDDIAVSEAEQAELIAGGSIGGIESSFAGALRVPQVPTAIANATLFPKVNALVINSESEATLSDDQRELLRRAAAGTVDWAVTTSVPDSEQAEVFCRNGGTMIVASDVDIAALEEASQSVYGILEQDAATRQLIAQLRDLGPSSTGVPVDATLCPAPPVETAPPAQPDASGFPEGVYRLEMPVQFLLDAGVDRATANGHAGTWTLAFEDGKFLDPTCPGSTYSVNDGRITIQLGPRGEGCGTAAGQVLFSAGWTVDGDQLQFVDVESGHGFQLLIENLFGGLPFTKIS